MKKIPFGIDYYSPPKWERAYLIKPRNIKIGTTKNKNFAEIEAKNKAFVPAPNIYNTAQEWTKKGNNGKFLKSQRLTLPMEIIKNKDKGTPSPGQYNTEVWKKFELSVTGNYN